MEHIEDAQNHGSEEGKILCCQCGCTIEPNPANMCVVCVRAQVDITKGIPKQATIYFCKNCNRYLQPPSEWIFCALESRELLALCLKKLRGLNRVKLIDAGFVWTEPHSKRIKVKLTVQGEVLGGTILEQVFVVEFIVSHQMCDDCHRSEAHNYWRARVQVRQKAENKKTFYYLEQLILKHRAHQHTLEIEPEHGGLNFLYATDAAARKMVDFMTTVLPCRCQDSKTLISHDIRSNTYNNKLTYSVEIVPVSRESLICLPNKLTHQLGGIKPLCLVYKVTNVVHIIDPNSAQIAEVSSTVFWRTPFKSICNPKQLIEFVVMNIEPILGKDRKIFPGQGALSNKHVLADVWVVRASELGKTENTIHARTHLGHILKIGDSALGYLLSESNINDDNFDKLDSSRIPDVVLVKKHYEDKGGRRKKRIWKLKHLAEETADLATTTNDYMEFLDDLEEDPELRTCVNIYRDKRKQQQMAVDVDDLDDPTTPYITLDEMLDDLDLNV